MKKKKNNIDDHNLLLLGMNASKSNINRNIFLKRKGKSKNFINKFLLTTFILLLIALSSVLGINQYVRYTSLPLVVDKFNDLSEYDAIIVLDTTTDSSVSLQKLLSNPLDIYFNNCSDKFLLTSNHSNSTEITAMKDFLIEEKIEPENIFLDYNGSSTYNSIYRAKEVYEIKNALIVSSELSLPRALYIAKSIDLNCNGVINVSTSNGGEFTLTNKVEEILLTFTDFIKLKFSNPDSSIFDDKIPVSGDGRITHQ